MARVFDHIDLRVQSLAAVKPFYDAFLHAYGFRPMANADPGCFLYVRVAERSFECVAITEDPEQRANKTRIAFGANSPEDVDRLAQIATKAGAQAGEGPMPCPEYWPTYYAFFFEDPEGNRLEICYR